MTGRRSETRRTQVRSRASKDATPSRLKLSDATKDTIEQLVEAQAEEVPTVRQELVTLIIALIRIFGLFAHVGRQLLHHFERKRQEMSAAGAVIAAAEAAGVLPIFQIRLVREVADLVYNAHETWTETKNKALLATSLIIVFGILYEFYCADPSFGREVYSELRTQIRHLPVLNVLLFCLDSAVKKSGRNWRKALPAMIQSLPQSMDATGIAIPASRILRRGIELYTQQKPVLQTLGELQEASVDSIRRFSPASLSTDPDFLLVAHLVNLVCSIYRAIGLGRTAEDTTETSRKLAWSFSRSLKPISVPSRFSLRSGPNEESNA
jgi:hypothetical protein